jgi:DNA polymerase I-like protein with 3'-5' exonuclease and polymerase domains
MTKHPSRITREPNLQTTPIRTELGRQIREAFAPDAPLFDIAYAELERRLVDKFGKGC